jgi:hypothetical protein
VDTSGTCPDANGEETEVWEKFWKHLWSHGLSIAAVDRESSPSAVKRAVIPGILALLRPSDRTQSCTGRDPSAPTPLPTLRPSPPCLQGVPNLNHQVEGILTP